MTACRLKSVSSGYPSLPLNGALLAIGLREKALRSVPEALRASLSERHARLFQDRNQWYLIDLNLPPRCQVNGRTIGSDPEKLQTGDRIRLTDELVYLFEVVDPLSVQTTDAFGQPSEGRLTLWPEGAIQSLPPLQVSRFPFLIGKQQSALSFLAANQPDYFRFLSRRHAQIFADGEEFFIEDLGSTNGTWLNGERQRGGVRPLADGDRVAFGHQDLSFRVEDCQVATQQAKETGEKREALPQGTILVSKAESFLDIYCDSGQSNKPESGNTPSPPITATAKPLPLAAQITLLWQRLRPAHRLFLATGLGLLALLTLSVWLQQDRRPEQVESLLARQQAGDALALARAYVRDHPDDSEARQILVRAWQQRTLPAWLLFYQQANWDGARALLAESKPDDGQAELLDTHQLLLWLTDLKQQVGTGDQPLRLYQDERRIAALLDNPSAQRIGAGTYNPVLDPLIERFPEMENVRGGALSDLRQLRSLESTLLPAISQIKKDIDQKLASNQLAILQEELIRFARDYPQVEGLTTIQSDLSHYSSLLRAVQSGDLVAYSNHEALTDFELPPFRQAAEALIRRSSGLEETAAAYREATSAWRNGQSDVALERLVSVPDSPWRPRLDELKNQWENKLATLELLRDAPRTPETLARLGRFYQSLDSEMDLWLRQQLMDALGDHKSMAIELAQTRLRTAEERWQHYQSLSGIGSALRLESRVSTDYTRRAELLVQATADLEEAEALEYFQPEHKRQKIQILKQALQSEVLRQRQALVSLRGVLEPSMVDAKLALLPPAER